MGTSAPEAAVSITAALKGSAAITIGNVVGSNILNVLIILGITACIIPVAVSRSTVRAELPYMILITGLLLGLGYTGRKNRPVGGHRPLAGLSPLSGLPLCHGEKKQGGTNRDIR